MMPDFEECPKGTANCDTFNKLPMAILYNPLIHQFKHLVAVVIKLERQFLIFNHCLCVFLFQWL